MYLEPPNNQTIPRCGMNIRIIRIVLCLHIFTLTVSTKNTSFASVSVKLVLGMNQNLVPPKIGWTIFRNGYIAPLHSGP